jgi:hypothetical protein
VAERRSKAAVDISHISLQGSDLLPPIRTVIATIGCEPHFLVGDRDHETRPYCRCSIRLAAITKPHSSNACPHFLYYIADMGKNVFEESSPDQWPTLRAEIHWVPLAGNATDTAVPGRIIERQRVRMSSQGVDPGTGEKTVRILAATCTFGVETDEGQTVQLSFWSTIDLGATAQPGCDLDLLSGDEVIATGKIV